MYSSKLKTITSDRSLRALISLLSQRSVFVLTGSKYIVIKNEMSESNTQDCKKIMFRK